MDTNATKIAIDRMAAEAPAMPTVPVRRPRSAIARLTPAVKLGETG